MGTRASIMFCPEGEMDFRNRYDLTLYTGTIVVYGHYGVTEREYNHYLTVHGITCMKTISKLKQGEKIK